MTQKSKPRSCLARELNDAGIPTATGKGRWHPSTIAAVVRSVEYEDELAAARGRVQAGMG